MNVESVMRLNEIETVFQPVVSIKKGRAVGVKPRFLGTGAGRIDGKALRREAALQGAALELDRMFRQAALASFSALQKVHPELFLFLNFDTSIVDMGIVGSGKLVAAVRDLGLNPNNIVIEIADSDAHNLDALSKFIEAHHEYGFLIGVGEAGSGHSNLIRLMNVRPDVVCVAPSLVDGIGADYYKRQIFQALAGLARDLGALVVAEGVRREEDALASLELGVDMLQGEYFGDAFSEGETGGAALSSSIADLTRRYKDHSVEKAKSDRTRLRTFERTFGRMADELSRTEAESFDERLSEIAGESPDVECLYVLDESGKQVSDTVSLPGKLLQHRKLFRPAERGADHSSKDYYYLLIDTFVNRFTTQPYISLATGRLCVTISGTFKDAKGRAFILCMDFPAGDD